VALRAAKEQLMADEVEKDVSLRRRTGAIVQLDATRARRLVAAFTRPVVATDEGLSRAGDDAIGSAAYGWVTLDRPEGELSFKRLRRLSPEAARGLSRHASDLYLAGLVRVPSQVAAALAMHRGNLTLEGCEQLSGRAARHLARYRGELHLHGLASLSDAVAGAFGGREGHLCLKKLRRLSPRQAQHLAAHRGPLLFHELDVDEPVAEWLGCHEGSLVIRVDDGIPHATLAALAQHRGPLEIGGLRSLDVARAKLLAARPCRRGTAGLNGLGLSGVARISPAVAAILATYAAGELSLSGLESLDEGVARELVKHPLLSLDRVRRLDDPVARILASHSGVSLSLRSLESASPSAIARLRDNPGIQLPRRFLETAAGNRQ